MLSRWATNSPSGSLAASGTLSKFFGLKATNTPFLPSAVGGGRIGGGQHVGGDPAGIHLLLKPAQDRRAAGAEHLDLDAGLLLEQLRRSSAPCSIGVEVYQTTLPSALALATSTASCACGGSRASVVQTAERCRAVQHADVVRDVSVRSLFIGGAVAPAVLPLNGSPAIDRLRLREEAAGCDRQIA